MKILLNQQTYKKLPKLTIGLLIYLASHLFQPTVQAHVYEPYETDAFYMVDNPKKKLRIKFVFKEDDKSDTTKKSLFTKVKGLLNTILDFSDNPPVRLEVSYTKEKKGKG